jgi:hypothetical protein
VTQVLYTTTDAIRAALGVTEKEIADGQIVNLSVRDQLLFSLEDVYPEHATLAAVQSGTPTADQVRLYTALTLFCQFEAAALMTAQLQMLTAQKITDGDAEMQRFQKDNLQDTINRIYSLRNRYGRVLKAQPSGTVSVAIFSTTQPAYDPVTDSGINPSPSSQ